MKFRKRGKWTRRLKQVAAPAGAVGAKEGPEAVQGFANVVKEVGEGLGPVLSNSFSILSSLLSLGANGLKFITENFVVLCVTLAAGYAVYKYKTSS